jgi:hypothetical protein
MTAARQPARQPKRRLLLVALVMLVWLAFGLSLPLLTLLRSDLQLGTSTQAADLSGGFVVTSPLVLSHSPRILLERGTLHALDSKGRPLANENNGSSGPAEFPRNATLVITNGEIKVDAGARRTAASTEAATATDEGLSAAAPAVYAHAALGLLTRQQIATVALRRTAVRVTLPDGEAETLRDATGDLKRGRNSWQFKGDGSLLGQRATVDLTLGVTAGGPAGQAAGTPLKFSIKHAQLDWQFDGDVVLGPELVLAGATEVEMTLPRQSSWLRRMLPESLGVATSRPLDLKAKGRLEWSAASITLNKAKFEIDGNEGIGTLSLDRRAARPLLTGTMAYQTLDLTRHVPATLTAPKPTPSSGGVGQMAAGKLTAIATTLLQSWGTSDFHLPMLTLLDADLRVSADRVEMGPVTLRRTAATISNNGGKLLADVAAFEFDGGRGTGQISGDFTGPLMKLGLRGRLDNLDAGQATKALFGTSFVDGRGIVTMDLTGTGASLTEVVKNARGRVTTGVPDGGRLSVDLRGLAAASDKRAIEGWSAGGRDQMSFEGLDATFLLTSGILNVEKSQARVRDEVIDMTGTVDMPGSRINLTAVGPFVGFSGPNPNVLNIFGPWSRPTIRLESSARKSANIPGQPVP